jgi:hypothetical protein
MARKPRRKAKTVEVLETPQHDWSLPTAHWLELDKARLAHWWAKLNGGDTVTTLAAWAKLLHIPRTRKLA